MTAHRCVVALGQLSGLCFANQLLGSSPWTIGQWVGCSGAKTQLGQGCPEFLTKLMLEFTAGPSHAKGCFCGQDVRRASHVVKYIQRKAHDRQLALEKKEGKEDRKESISNL